MPNSAVERVVVISVQAADAPSDVASSLPPSMPLPLVCSR